MEKDIALLCDGMHYVPRIAAGQPDISVISPGLLSEYGIRDSCRLVSIHNHSSPASPCAATSIGQLRTAARRKHLDCTYLTDHHVLTVDESHSLQAGVELKTEFGEVNLLDVRPHSILPEKKWRDVLDFSYAQREAGAILGLNHPFSGQMLSFLPQGRRRGGFDFAAYLDSPGDTSMKTLVATFDYVELNTNNYSGRDAVAAMQLADEYDTTLLVGEDTHFTCMVGRTGFNAIPSHMTLREALAERKVVPVLTRKGAAYVQGGWFPFAAWQRLRSGIRKGSKNR
ncbi:MAG: hypothetical protein ACOCWQ_05265 [Nanoarchaeota archaeon]